MQRVQRKHAHGACLHGARAACAWCICAMYVVLEKIGFSRKQTRLQNESAACLRFQGLGFGITWRAEPRQLDCIFCCLVCATDAPGVHEHPIGTILDELPPEEQTPKKDFASSYPQQDASSWQVFVGVGSGEILGGGGAAGCS